MLTQERLKEILNYNPDTGIFTRNIDISFGRYKKGTKVNSRDRNGYIRIMIDGVRYGAHRLAFLYMKGYFPENQIDHIDRIKDNNKWLNLREASSQCQSRNCGLISTNTSGVKGVSWLKCKNKWVAQIKINGKRKNLGKFSDFIEAVALRFAVEQCLDWGDCDTNSSAGSYLKSLKMGSGTNTTGERNG